MKKVMFLCTANSCRSQMAEGFAKEYGKGVIEVFSAGLFAAGVHRRAAEVMREAGIDITKQKSKEIDPSLLKKMDFVVTLCGNAKEHCPRPPASSAATFLHIPIKDPVGTSGSEEAVMNDFRRAREEIRQVVLKLLREITDSRI